MIQPPLDLVRACHSLGRIVHNCPASERDELLLLIRFLIRAAIDEAQMSPCPTAQTPGLDLKARIH